ncbi:DUF2087 domain-containing protein [Myceligenerans pegani]|uniref:DUF2087 domain-containing protein n=1 Tax=Myceligenerans pegani TaxID=2776917 RepID=A0ABR9N223_9MICO|nr:DUF2087 domain-containing protein [Myceligenerans sp. TRM 65318]MBE1877057.1 DUF2087 domain-containing protein [Myceligenerans sp. TRM 65318]MBE3019328.1 DUF2087 domain-containing protein [Myceligenerans sp. TRM 65318]
MNTPSDPAKSAAVDPRRFLLDGRLETLPRRRRDKVAVTRYIATRALPHLLEPIGERELTERLARVARDPVGLRRAMVDLGLVTRTRDGSEYWRTERTEYDDQDAADTASLATRMLGQELDQNTQES